MRAEVEKIKPPNHVYSWEATIEDQTPQNINQVLHHYSLGAHYIDQKITQGFFETAISIN
jgi:hypothetical protein